MAKSTHTLHNTMMPGPEEPGDQNQAVDPEGKTGTQTRTDTELQNNQVQRGRDLGMTTDQKNGQRQVKGRKKKSFELMLEETCPNGKWCGISKKFNPLYMPQCNTIL